MAFSLYAFTVPPFIQILGSMSILLDRAEQFCMTSDLAPEEIIEARIIEDMRPFAYQIAATVMHSVGALDALAEGEFRPYTAASPNTFSALRGRVQGARSSLSRLAAEEVDRLEGRGVRFVDGEFCHDFTAEDFIVLFSLPNFYFHATTAYNILRMRGVQIGKSDFTGRG